MTPTAPPVSSTVAEQRTTQRRRIVIAFLILLGLAGILAVSGSAGDGVGAPGHPETAAEPAR